VSEVADCVGRRRNSVAIPPSPALTATPATHLFGVIISVERPYQMSNSIFDFLGRVPLNNFRFFSYVRSTICKIYDF